MAMFKSANAAVRWAINYSNEVHVERSAMNKMSDISKGIDSGREQGQAGAIQAMMHATGEFHEACLVARAAAHKIPCSCGAPCCSKSRPNWVWYEAVNFINMEVKRVIDLERKEKTRGIKDDPTMRRALVSKYFGVKVKINEVARACEVSDMTVATHSGKIIRILKQTEGESWQLMEERLRNAGIID